MAGWGGGALGAVGGIAGKVAAKPAPKKTPVYGGNNGMQGIAGTTRQGQTPAQYYAPAPVYQAPAAYGPPAGGFAGGGGGGGMGPIAPSRPIMSEADWLNGDSEFQSQENEYNRALKEFETRIGKKKKNFEDDYKQSEGVTNQNQAQSLTGLGEDFASRGMAYSGVFDQSRTSAEDTFKRQLANLLTVKNRNDAQAEDDLADYRSENQLSRGNSRRNALARFANSQSLA